MQAMTDTPISETEHTSTTKRPVGRPSTYDPAFCEQVIALGLEGASKHEMALELGCAWATFHNWQEAHPEFMDAIKAATEAARGWWEKQGRTATFGAVPGFNATSYIFNMKNRFPDGWREKIDSEHTGKLQIGVIERIIVDPRPLPPGTPGVS